MRAAVEAHGEHLAGLKSQMKGEATQERSEAMVTVQSSMRENHAAAMERTLATHADEMAALRAEAEARQSAATEDLRRTHEEATVVLFDLTRRGHLPAAPMDPKDAGPR